MTNTCSYVSRPLSSAQYVLALHAPDDRVGHSRVTVTMRYTHTNLESKKAAVEQLANFGHNLLTVCTKMQQFELPL